MLYAAIAIIAAGIVAALAPLVREWAEHRHRAGAGREAHRSKHNIDHK